MYTYYRQTIMAPAENDDWPGGKANHATGPKSLELNKDTFQRNHSRVCFNNTKLLLHHNGYKCKSQDICIICLGGKYMQFLAALVS